MIDLLKTKYKAYDLIDDAKTLKTILRKNFKEELRGTGKDGSLICAYFLQHFITPVCRFMKSEINSNNKLKIIEVYEGTYDEIYLLFVNFIEEYNIKEN